MITLLTTIIDKTNEAIGKTVRWLLILMVFGTFANVVWRYVFEKYSIPLNESVIIMNSMVFMLGAAYALQTNQHVRVDVFYEKFSIKKKAVADLIGTIFFLLPMCGFLLYSSWGYALSSWQIHEASANTGGLPGLYLVKTIIPLTAFLMFLQGLSDIVSNIKKIKRLKTEEVN